MTKRNILIILILILAFSLRYFKIAQFPKTLYGDEQAFAWNAYSILKTGADEYGSPYPLQFRSFDDYKAPVPVYLLVPVFKLLGMNAYSIRLPVVLASFATVLVFYFFCRLFLSVKISLLAAFLFSISPWHVHLSRGYFEATLSLLFFMSGIYFFFRFRRRFRYLFASAVFFTLALYSYFTPRMLLPVFLPFLMAFDKKRLKSAAQFLLIIFLLSFPLIYVSFLGKGLSRFEKLNRNMMSEITAAVNQERNASALTPSVRVLLHNKATVWVRTVKNNYLEHFSLNFWYLYGDNSLRYFLGNMGMFYLFEMPFLFLGFYYLFRTRRKLLFFLGAWLLLAPLPAAVVGRSFAVRSLSMLPAPFIIVAAGIYFTLSHIRGIIHRRIFSGFLTLAVILFVGHVMIKYYFEYPVYAATWWGWENKAALDYSGEREGLYDYIFISDYYTGAPLSYAVYKSFNPAAFRQAINNPITVADGRRMIKLGKYYFGSLDLNKERLSQNIIPPRALYIGRPEEADSDETINAPADNRVIFKIHKTQ